MPSWAWTVQPAVLQCGRVVTWPPSSPGWQGLPLMCPRDGDVLARTPPEKRPRLLSSGASFRVLNLRDTVPLGRWGSSQRRQQKWGDGRDLGQGWGGTERKETSGLICPAPTRGRSCSPGLPVGSHRA